MAIPPRRISPDRLDFEGSLTPKEVDSIAGDTGVKVLQTSKPVEPKTWDLLNTRFFSVRPDVQLRIYGHYGSSCDLACLRQLGNVRRFAADCLMQAAGVEHVARLENLESLSIGIYGLDSFGFLNDLASDKLTHLFLGATFSKRPRLDVIERFSGLRELYLEGQSKGIESVGSLTHLEDLTLRSITVPSLSFLRGLSDLWSVDIKLGGTRNLGELAELKGVKYLELWQVKGLTDLSPIAEMTGLQFIFLQALRNVERLPSLSRLTKLRRIYLENMKGLKDLASLATAPALEELIHVAAQGRKPQEYADLLAKGRIKRMIVGFGSDRKNEELRAMMRAAGVQEYEHSAFAFT